MYHLRMVDNQAFTKRRISSDLIINAPGKQNSTFLGFKTTAVHCLEACANSKFPSGLFVICTELYYIIVQQVALPFLQSKNQVWGK